MNPTGRFCTARCMDTLSRSNILILHATTYILGVVDIVAEVDQKLGKAALSGCIIPQHGREGGVTKWLGKAVAKCFPSSIIITESMIPLAFLQRQRAARQHRIPKKASDN